MATETDWGEHTRRALDRAGHRTGGARDAVVELLAVQECCLTAQEIFDELRASGRAVGIASVYRALDLLTSMSLVHRLEMGPNGARYEPANVGGEHHHHVVCSACGKVTPFEDAGLEDALERIASTVGYEVEGHDVVLRGSCPECVAA
jgi:Fur family ferric uptake transcriptional regulator